MAKSPRRCAASGTARGTPCAEKITGASVSGTSSSSRDEDRALPLEALDHVLVVDDLVPHIDRRAVHRERLLDGVDRPHDACAEAARRAEQDGEGRLRHGSPGVPTPLLVSSRQMAPRTAPLASPSNPLYNSRSRNSPSSPSEPMASAASHVSFLPPVLTFCAAAVVAVPVFRLAGLSAVLGYLAAGVVIGPSGLALDRGRRDDRDRRRARRRAAALHRRARTEAVRSLGHEAGHLRPRPRPARAVRGDARRRRDAVRLCGPGRGRDGRVARPVGDRDRAPDAGGARRPADLLRPADLRHPPVPGHLDRADPRHPAAARRDRRPRRIRWRTP